MSDIDKILASLEKLADKIGSTVELLWPEALRYLVVQSIVEVIFGFVVFTVCLIGFSVYLKHFNEFDDFRYSIPAFIFALVGGYYFSHIIYSLATIFNPAGYLTMKILGG